MQKKNKELHRILDKNRMIKLLVLSRLIGSKTSTDFPHHGRMFDPL